MTQWPGLIEPQFTLDQICEIASNACANAIELACGTTELRWGADKAWTDGFTDAVESYFRTGTLRPSGFGPLADGLMKVIIDELRQHLT